MGNNRDITEDYLHFSVDDLREPAAKVERHILELAGRIDNDSAQIDAMLSEHLAKMGEESKRTLLKMLTGK